MYTLGVGKKTPSETSRLAECVGDTRSLLWKILADSHRNLAACHQQAPGNNKHHVPNELSKFQVNYVHINMFATSFLKCYAHPQITEIIVKLLCFCRSWLKGSLRNVITRLYPVFMHSIQVDLSSGCACVIYSALNQ